MGASSDKARESLSQYSKRLAKSESLYNFRNIAKLQSYHWHFFLASIESERCLHAEDVIGNNYEILVFDSLDDAIGDIAVVDGSVKRTPVAI